MKNNYYLTGINVQKMYDKGFKGKGVIGVLDSGFKEHNFLPKDLILEGRNFVAEGEEDSYLDYNGHGTAVISTIYNICPDVKIIIAKVINKDGQGDMQATANGMRYLIDKEVDIISCSLGAPGDDSCLRQVVELAKEKNIPIVAASGNEGDGVFSTNEICYPAYYDYTIEVGAIDDNNNITNFSNSNSEVDVVSYGLNTTCCGLNNDYIKISGTSFSTPIISACMLLLKQQYLEEFRRQPTEAELYALLIKNTIDLEDVDRYEQGFGRFCFK